MRPRDVDAVEPVITRSRRTSSGCVHARDTAPDVHPATKRADALDDDDDDDDDDDGASSREVDDGASTTRERAMTRRASRRVRDEALGRRETTRARVRVRASIYA